MYLYREEAVRQAFEDHAECYACERLGVVEAPLEVAPYHGALLCEPCSREVEFALESLQG